MDDNIAEIKFFVTRAANTEKLELVKQKTKDKKHLFSSKFISNPNRWKLFYWTVYFHPKNESSYLINIICISEHIIEISAMDKWSDIKQILSFLCDLKYEFKILSNINIVVFSLFFLFYFCNMEGFTSREKDQNLFLHTYFYFIFYSMVNKKINIVNIQY